jgi:predicted nucleic acid-binding protein
MKAHSSLLTVDSNIIIAALRATEPASSKCAEILAKASEQFMLVEPSIIYQEVCGTLARKIDLETANTAKEQLDLLIEQKRLINCDKKTCISAFRLCTEYEIYAIDALYLHVALSNYAVLVSLDKEFIDKLNDRLPIEAYTVDNYPY